ncbi:hypothetical protein HG535_0H02810 [Zygotorulaspora mrakii]|uniref:Metallo-beta-lactamase domain-containing protein n=1 Tax=Zygotorulaspora mrakii TaxID=42260 RepID=A0A7H9B9I3_ZYGMR|nr:uncharacterized protein HG535_0H02810 [Zygotorulaspora mrakii]QLG74954.1 hypothetical protein HG535_0H02810 [Zygotorulaspora mrakii]
MSKTMLRFVRPKSSQGLLVHRNAYLRHRFSARRTGKRFFGSHKDRNSEEGPSRHYVLGALLTILVPYTGYALFVTTSASKEIDNRREKCTKIEKIGENYQGTLVKYSPLQILGRYENPFDEYRIQTIYEFFCNRVIELFQRNRGGIPVDPVDMRSLMPIHKPTWDSDNDIIDFNNDSKPLNCQILAENSPEAVSIQYAKDPISNIPVYNTWLGQSCNYTIYNGLKILTDPLFTDFLLHEQLGPKRITEMPCNIEEIPTPDIILVSHNHPDHLDFKSIEFWKTGHPLWIVPKGLGYFMVEHGVSNVIELSWWQTCEVTKNDQTYHFSCTPAMHWSGRSLLDANRSLWCSYMLSHKGKPILFHGGDTGYVKDLFTRIKQRYGKCCRLALLPCGQYCPEWHQKPRHINPQEVIKIMKDLEAENVLGVHWGTFVLSGEYFREPKEKLEMLARWKSLEGRCFCPELGKTEKF